MTPSDRDGVLRFVSSVEVGRTDGDPSRNAWYVVLESYGICDVPNA